MKGIIYTRVSSDEQVKGTSLDVQEAQCRQYCDDKGIEVLEVFREEGESAKSVDRTEFLRAIEFCRKNKGIVDAFVVAKVDRFARNTEDHFYVRKRLLEYKVTLHSVTEPIGDTPVGKLIETILAGTSDFDNAVRKQRCSDGMSAKINQGLYPWKPPIGYLCLNVKKRGEKKTEPDPPDETTFPIIQRALREFAQGLHTKAALSRQMDEWGLRNIRGKRTTEDFVFKLLKPKRVKFYAGILVNPFEHDRKVDGKHTPMITKDEMHQILFILAGKDMKSIKYNRHNPSFPLRRTVLCGRCMKSLTGSRSRGMGGVYSYYHCHYRQCPIYGKSIAKKTLEQDFLRYLAHIKPKEKFLAVFNATVLEVWRENGQGFALQARTYAEQLTRLEAKLKRIFDAKEEGDYTREEFLERKAKVENQITAISISLNETHIEQFDVEASVSYATNFIRTLGRQWFDLSPQLRPQFQKLLFPDGIPYDRETGFGTAKLGLIYKINQQCDGSKSSLVDCMRIGWNSILKELAVWDELRRLIAEQTVAQIAA